MKMDRQKLFILHVATLTSISKDYPEQKNNLALHIW